ncbi:ubiquinone/menaquinone biosynthesis C-methylase UbiE [Breznakia sp. PF5-3]|uniref:class I SAM-dependent DNA methyltransferase n=1 Tax=unclassified Breznakia TaxID=2623764 RepID=UPI002406A347|nr:MULTISPECIES: class I SAM-dependent methyltransferase [unclassified Breznakia]MDF9824080.1 ubiquinone/menaquinone biosynthesis C-methylase UbiE [Breznakia sp. PM6-1]MDF9834854.1 ubiquinone/menaquinone biosynthesis C-methylase UbiE [Breznakia sp. PF5-3]MDF9837124.1 ubiquinone/menaquinone biosynthesis C-methylase UbiE [Breznakia sp. PFB2-8]MDF9859049.1 ubiquinone/menaquinone biosynthesis C-methylase UbiE [Breznakia sp. PH5-24]
MYNVLAKHYDSLVKDEDATKQYVEFVKQHMLGDSIMELACGSGEISLALAKTGYRMVASDISASMLKVAKAKDATKLIDYQLMDMTKINDSNHYDAIICFCDSLNYLESDDLVNVFTSVYEHLNEQGVWMFDMHSLDRLEEFSEAFYEAGIVDGVEYTWSICSEEDKLYHNFIFYDDRGNPQYENHIQNVFDPQEVKQLLEAIGFHLEIFTDFEKKGIQSGEKYFFVCRKGSV